MLGRQSCKLLAIINVLLVARAEQEPESASLMTVVLRQQPMQHGSEGRNSSSGRNEDGVAQGRAQNEIAEWSLKRNVRAFLQIAEIVRHESIGNAVQAEGDVSICGRRGRYRIGACDFLAVGSVSLDRKPLSGDKAEMVHAAHREFEVLGEFGERKRAKHAGVESFELSHRWIG